MSFIWRTMLDDRVRPSHAEREGQVFPDDYFPKPGDEINCRCWEEKVSEPDINESDILESFCATFLKSLGINVALNTVAGLINTYTKPKQRFSASLLTTSSMLGVQLATQEDKSAKAIAQTVGVAAFMYGASSLAQKYMPSYAKLILFGLRTGLNLAYGDSLSTIAAKELGRAAGGIAGASVLGSITGKISGYKQTTKTSPTIETVQKVKEGPTRSPRGRPPYKDETRIAKAEDYLNRAAGTVPFKLGGNTRLMKNTISKIDTKLQNLDATRSIENPTYRASLANVYYMGKYNVLYPKIQKPLSGNLDPRSEKGLRDLSIALNKQMNENNITVESARTKAANLIFNIATRKPGQIF